MRPIYLPILLIICFCNFTYAQTSSDISELISLAKQQYQKGNYEKSISLYKQASELGSPKAMLLLSSIYQNGKAVGKDMAISEKYLLNAQAIYEKQANKGDPDAQFNLGKIYSYYIKPPNKLEAYNWYLMAAKNGHMLAQYAVAGILDRGTLEPAIKRDYKEAIKWYEKSARQGNSRAAWYLAYRNRGDFDAVLKWCMPVARKTDDEMNSKCIELLSNAIAREIYSKKYKEKSIRAIHELANSGAVMFQVALAKMYKEGKVLDKDNSESERWSKRAYNTALSRAEDGNKTSQYELALLYEKGIGTEVSLDKARKWLNEASKQGYKPAIRKLAELNQ